MINGAHAIIYSTDPDADRNFLRDVLQLGHVDVGHGWLIFGLPPAEVAVHPSEKNGVHELYFMCDDVELFIAAMQDNGVTCGPIQDQGWGRLTQVSLPGGGKLGVYQPRHARPEATPTATTKTVAKKPARATGARKLAKPARRPAVKVPAAKATKKPAPTKTKPKGTKKLAKKPPTRRK